MQRKRASLSKKMVACWCFLACTAVATSVFWPRCRNAWLTIYWENELSAANGEQAAAVLERLLALGRPGRAAVVRALGAPHFGAAAYQTIDRELDRWEGEPALEVTVKLADLAEALAERAETLPPDSQARAAKLAMRMLRWPDRNATLDSGRFVAACDRVLRVCDRQQVTSARLKPAALDTAKSGKQKPLTVQTQTPTMMPADASMYLELAELAAPDLPRADAPDGKIHAEPRLLFAGNAEALVAQDKAKNKKPASAAAHSSVAVAGYTRDADAKQNEDPAQAIRRGMLTLDPTELFAQLNEVGEIAAAAAAELDSRGFSRRQIEVGKHLTSPDAAERLRWAEALPGIRGMDARFWLLRLSHDVNLQVRRAAVGLLATDRDPEVIRRLRQIVVDETDAQLRDQAGRALEVWESP